MSLLKPVLQIKNMPTCPLRLATLVGTSILTVGACGQEESGTPSAQEAVELMGTVWNWQEFQDSADGDEASHISVPDPAKYTLTLRSDDSADIQADCNQLSWTYSLEGSRLRFNTLGPSTMAYCGDESLDQRYLERLGNTATYVMVDDTLYLNLTLDSGNMIFAAAE